MDSLEVLHSQAMRKTFDPERPFWGCPGTQDHELCSWDSTKAPVVDGAAPQDPASLAPLTRLRYIYIVPGEKGSGWPLPGLASCTFRHWAGTGSQQAFGGGQGEISQLSPGAECFGDSLVISPSGEKGKWLAPRLPLPQMHQRHALPSSKNPSTPRKVSLPQVCLMCAIAQWEH